ncbi:hypothetical protein [uncultured Arcobacter sp.]|uniref:hypothetical protein n=1 Tax=uncultured Arcobacter sp. TaxID=165434 RepID=UPI00262BA652|nr:hypothetical protein [uncultured Arcobacter sp.]
MEYKYQFGIGTPATKGGITVRTNDKEEIEEMIKLAKALYQRYVEFDKIKKAVQQ